MTRALALVPPLVKLQTVGQGRKPNTAYRTREHLTEQEVERLLQALKANRNGHRDSLMALMAYRHGLRVSELLDMRWDDVNFEQATLNVRRLKGSDNSTQPIEGQELRALRALRRDQAPQSAFIFISENWAPFTRDGFNKMVERAGVKAGFTFPLHPHMLRHACGFVLASKGTDTRTLQAYLGHRAIRHTVRYTAMSPNAFKNIWE